LTLRGCYLGSNVSYNLKKLVENGYLHQDRSMHDRRAVHIKLTDQGLALRDRLSAMHSRHLEMLKQTAVTQADLASAIVTLRRLERFWANTGDLTARGSQVAA
jgi:DNA-binding MarR family transcriptional regulator